jgi:hypothetical protein
MLSFLVDIFPPLIYFPQVLKFLALFAPFVVPIILGYLFIYMWFRYIRTRWISQQNYVLLEIKIPKEITKSPLAMEVVLTSLYQTGALNYTDTYWLGKVRPWFSLEMVSIGGQIRFFIWSFARFKDLIEAQIYGQYPDVEIQEVDDYTVSVKHNPKEVTMWGTNHKLTQKDAYPIKTYVDYGIDREVEEEFKVDPITAVFEYLGSLKKGEQAWIQILIQAHKEEWLREGKPFKKRYWKKDAQKEIEKIRKEAAAALQTDDSSGPSQSLTILTKGQQELIGGIERSMGKFPFDCMVRSFYIAKNESFSQIAIPGLIGSVRQYNSNTLNGFKLGRYTDHSDIGKDFINIGSLFFPPLRKMMRKRRDRFERTMLSAYKMRSFFHPPHRYYRAKPFILTTEELATIFHFPGQVATTPSLERIPSRRAEPPPGLPI